jgi:hypothetical protein
MLESGFQNTQPERRQSQRYRLNDGSLATNSNILGPILNLSMHGMAFEYYAEDLDDSEVMEIGIFICHSKTLLTGLKARLVRDQVIKNRNSFLPAIQRMRAIEFLDISDDQRRQLHQILATQSIETI